VTLTVTNAAGSAAVTQTDLVAVKHPGDRDDRRSGRGRENR
jgi:PKD repeat protein